ASFYAHQTYRGKYHEIGLDLIQSGFDFFAGSDFLKPKASKGGKDLYALCADAGYSIVRGMDEWAKRKSAGRFILLQSLAASERDRSALPYALDRKEGDLTLPQITRAAIEHLTSRGKNGFFVMIEGGKIDWACHSNDAATVFEEVRDFDEAIKVAYAFYQQHPDETLIVVTADHETGGIGLGNSNYTLRTDLLRHQTMSSGEYSTHLKDLMKRLGSEFNYAALRADLEAHFGFWKSVPLTEKQEDRLEKAFDELIEHRDRNSESMYASELAIADLAKRILNEQAKLGWTSGQHTHGYVPVFAIGAGAEAFHGRIDNTDVPKLIGRVAGY
ncbi:MAG: alkaline phosphatase, partial [Bacteroidaceae bacterium]|nr:alkaline phosphatase [Bacteroidaceae bacterium]